MPRKLLSKIIRQIDADGLQGFTLDRKSGELCYMARERAKTVRIPQALCRDFFAVVEKALANQKDPLDQRFRLLSRHGKISIGLKRGEGASDRLEIEIEKSGNLIGFKRLGFNLAQQKKIRGILKKPQGLIVCGLPAGNGLSNLVYALAAEIDRENRSAYLLAANEEYKISHLNFIPLQLPFESDLRQKISWLNARDADVVIVPEIYERESALEVAKLANAGHLVIAGCRSRDAFSVLNSFLKAGPKRQILDNFSLIISGRQVKRLCPHCVEKYQPSSEELNAFARRFSWKKRNVDSIVPKTLLRSVGCPHCHYHGHQEKIGLYETLTIDKHWAKGDGDLLAIRKQALENGYQPLIINALEAAKNGLISLHEVLSLKI